MFPMTALPWGAPLTHEDLQRIPDDGHRYELVDGTLLVTPAPGTAHQVAVGALFSLLAAARRGGHVVLMAPFDYVVSEHTVLQPDLLIAPREALGERSLMGTPLLVVEVVSPSTRAADLGTKRLAYEAAGVPSYWVVDPAVPSLTVLGMVEGRLATVAEVAGEDAYTAAAPFPVTVVPARLLDDLRE